MAASIQDIQDFFSLTGNKPALTTAQLQKIQLYLTEHIGIPNPTPDDVVDFMYDSMRGQVVSYLRQKADVDF